MDVTLNESVSTTISEGLKFIQGIAKHLPEALTEQTHSVTLSFQKILRELDEAKGMCVPELNSNYITRRTNFPKEQIEPDYVTLSPTPENFSNVIERMPMNISPKTTTNNYTTIQQNNNNNNQTNFHTPRIRLNITVNRKPKGMYYCLMEKGVLLLDRNINAENSEYVIPLSEYTFQAVNNFTIKLTKNELEISLLFCSMTERNTWFNYITAARDSVHSYVTIDRCNINTKTNINPSVSLPIRRCGRVYTIQQSDSDSETAKRVYASRLTRNNFKAPLPILKNTDSSDSIEQVSPKTHRRHLTRTECTYLPLKQ